MAVLKKYQNIHCAHLADGGRDSVRGVQDYSIGGQDDKTEIMHVPANETGEGKMSFTVTAGDHDI